MPYKCSSCGLEYDTEEEAKECCGADAEMITEEDIEAILDGDEEEEDDDEEEEEEE
jgi:hypothetical protein